MSARAVLVTPRHLATGRWRDLLELPPRVAAARARVPGTLITVAPTAPTAPASAPASARPKAPAAARTRRPLNPAIVARVVRVLARLPFSPWRGTCLYRSVAVCLAYRFAGVDAVLRLGAAPGSDESPLAHAWVEGVDGTLLYERREGFVPLRPTLNP